MKKAFLVLTVALGSLVSSAQLKKLDKVVKTKVGEIKTMGVFFGDLTYTVNDLVGDTTYTLTYRNAEFVELTVFERIEFKADTETINTLYSIFADAFNKEDIKEYSQTVALGKCVMTVKGVKSFGAKGVQLYVTNEFLQSSRMAPIAQKHVNNLFGK